MKTNEDTQFTLSLKDYLDDKFKAIAERLGVLGSSIDNLIRETNNTKDRLSKAESDIIGIQSEHEAFRGVFRLHMKIILVTFVVFLIMMVTEIRQVAWKFLEKYLGF